MHEIEHGSDHKAIETTFDIAPPKRIIEQRLLFKNAPWKAIQERIANALQNTLVSVRTQEQADQLMAIVVKAVYTLTPKAKPSPYAKRWWTTDLTSLRRTYTYWRNQAKAYRRRGAILDNLGQWANDAAKEYHDAIRRQRKAYWNEFLEEDTNIWQVTRFLDPSGSPSFDIIPPLVRMDNSITQGKEEQAAELLETFFPPLPQEIIDDSIQHQHPPVL